MQVDNRVICEQALGANHSIIGAGDRLKLEVASRWKRGWRHGLTWSGCIGIGHSVYGLPAAKSFKRASMRFVGFLDCLANTIAF